MSGNERRRMVLLAEVKKGKLSVAAAGRVMGVCYRQAKRIWGRFKKMAVEESLVLGAKKQNGVTRC